MSNFPQRRSSKRDTFGEHRCSLMLPLTTSVLCGTWRQLTAASLNGGLGICTSDWAGQMLHWYHHRHFELFRIWWLKEMKRTRRGTGRYLLEEKIQSGSSRTLSTNMGT